MIKPLVSVLTPVYNAEKFLDGMLESIRGQTLNEIEFILVDDGSEDSSRLIIDRHAREDQRIRIIQHTQNLGIVKALNHGLEACNGKYIARMDADDIALPNRLKTQVAYMEENPKIAVLGTAISYIDEEGEQLGWIRRCEVEGSLLNQNPLLHPTVIIRRDILETNQLRYKSQFQYAEDYYLWLEIAKISKIWALNEVLLYYRISKSALRVRKLKPMISATLKVKFVGWYVLGFTPTFSDVLRYGMELLLLMLPSRLVWWLSIKLRNVQASL